MGLFKYLQKSLALLCWNLFFIFDNWLLDKWLFLLSTEAISDVNTFNSMSHIPQKITGKVSSCIQCLSIYDSEMILHSMILLLWYYILICCLVFVGMSPIHNEQICSTWGNFHFKTFDGDIFQLHSTCNYVLTSSCQGSYTDFNIQIRREEAGGHPTIRNIIMNLEGSLVELSKGSVVIDGKL